MPEAPSNVAAPLVELVDVTAALPEADDAPEARGVHWSIEPGQFWAVGGLPTAGESCLLPTAAGLMRPTAGIVRLFGRAIASDTGETELLETRRRIGLVFSNGGRLFRDQSVLGNITIPLRYHFDLPLDEAESRTEALVDMLGLKPWLHRSAITLPLVWQQRTALARALALQPEVLFLDRPLSALDFSHRGWWLEFLGELAAGLDGRPPVTVVVGGDSMKPWLEVASNFACLDEGRWETVADPAATDHDARDVTARFTRKKN